VPGGRVLKPIIYEAISDNNQGPLQQWAGLKKFPGSGRVCKIHFAHAGEIIVMSLCQIADEQNFLFNE